MNKMLRTLPMLGLVGSLLLTACPATGGSSGGADFQMSRGYRTINVDKAGQLGPIELTVPALTAQEFKIVPNSNAVSKYTIAIGTTGGSVDLYACVGKPCTGFSTTSDWKDLSDEEIKGIDVTVNNSNPDYVYAFNRTRSSRSYKLLITAAAR